MSLSFNFYFSKNLLNAIYWQQSTCSVTQYNAMWKCCGKLDCLLNELCPSCSSLLGPLIEFADCPFSVQETLNPLLRGQSQHFPLRRSLLHLRHGKQWVHFLFFVQNECFRLLKVALKSFRRTNGLKQWNLSSNRSNLLSSLILSIDSRLDVTGRSYIILFGF